ncbi:MAG: hypothetical protein NWF09_07675 [Candidatus Bathyarchaeota archaeon]|nr:hypothetical protein [Candidatus Bathyarchaeota archaeon]
MELEAVLETLVWPIIKDAIATGLFDENSIELLVESTIRELIKELNRNAYIGDYDALRFLINQRPEDVKKAIKYTSKKVKWRIRNLMRQQQIS